MRRPSRFGYRVAYYRSLLPSSGSGGGFCAFWLFFIAFVVTLWISLPSAFGQDAAADLVLGQMDFTGNGGNAGQNATNAVEISPHDDKVQPMLVLNIAKVKNHFPFSRSVV
jgi:hypothetical protein